MKIHNLVAKISSKKLIVYPLVIVLMGVFLLPKTAYLSTVDANNIIKLTNKERNGHNLNTLESNDILAKAAYAKGEALFKNQTFSHTIDDKKFSAWVKEAGYGYSFVGENLAIDFVSSEGVIKAWLDSPTHRKNLLNEKFSEIGVAVLEGKFQGETTTIVVQIFGTPLNYELATANNSEVLKLKNSDNVLSEFKIEDENLLTNVENNSSTTTVLKSNHTLSNSENYLTVLNVKPAQAAWENSSPKTNLISNLVYLFLITIFSILAMLAHHKTLLLKNKNI